MPMWLLLAAAVPVLSQVCNNLDPESGGLIIPAFWSAQTKTNIGTLWCVRNMSDPGQSFGSGCVPPANDTQEGIAIIYLLFLLWSFSGVGIIADIFMSAIEQITSTYEIKEQKLSNGKIYQVEIFSWNATVANLTLMALGSSAPEICLAVIEIIGQGFYSGELGPSTIVGSASFNLFVISAACIVSIPAADTDPHKLGYRKIKDMGVFAVTASFSIFAYVWLVIILSGSSPDKVSVAEGVLTFLFFPALTIIAYGADKGWCTREKDKRTDAEAEEEHHIRQIHIKEEETAKEGGEGDKLVPAVAPKVARRKGSVHGDQKEMEALLKSMQASTGKSMVMDEETGQFREERSSVAHYRMNAMQKITGSSIKTPQTSARAAPASSRGDQHHSSTYIGFNPCRYTVVEGVDKNATLKLVKQGQDIEATVTYRTFSTGGANSARAGEDFHEVIEDLTFKVDTAARAWASYRHFSKQTLHLFTVCGCECVCICMFMFKL